jgi:uncharacterized lipoprotein
VTDPNEVKSAVQRIYASTKGEIERMVAHYGGTMKDVLETRHWEKIDSILDARSRMEALELSEKAMEKVRTSLIGMWARKKIPGPQTPENYEKKAKKAESLVKMQEKKGNDAAAERQRRRAHELRARAAQLRTGQSPLEDSKKPRRSKQ